MTEPVYSYVRGQGWVPSTDQGFKVGWCAQPINVMTREEITSRVNSPELFFEFIQHLGDGTPTTRLRRMNPSFCYGNCRECEETFSRAWSDYCRVTACLDVHEHGPRLEAAITLWGAS